MNYCKTTNFKLIRVSSNYLGWQLAEAAQAADRCGFEGFTCLQQRHTYLEPGLRANFGTQLLLTPEIEEYCQNQNLTIMAYSSLLGGAYVHSGKPIPVQYQCAANDFRIKNLKQLAFLNQDIVQPNKYP
jgi:aryl-alcohol dehydrogenase-like predicted oxidoreductase